MPSSKYYLRQANAFLELAQSIGDTQLLSNDDAAVQRDGI
jgi:hypothetical protein